MEQISQQINRLPQGPGVYMYKDESGTVIYVGKAKNLKNRVKQYFRPDKERDEKTEALVSQIDKMETIRTMSEFDAILLEAKLINKIKPKYNVAARDDKSPIYVIIRIDPTKPGVYVKRGKELDGINKKTDTIFGPFQSGRTTRMLLRSIRRVIPYCTQKKYTGRACFYTQIGLCNPCPGEFLYLSQTEQAKNWQIYKNNLRLIIKLLSGKTQRVEVELIKEMRLLSLKEKFEEAALTRNQIQALKMLLQQKYDPELYVSDGSFLSNKTEEEKTALIKVLAGDLPQVNNLERIECVDISNTGGRQAVGAIVVLTDGIPDNGEYRKFRIKQISTPNDVGAMKEVLKRRFMHKEWKYPNLLVVDGGKGQVAMANETLTELGLNIPILGLAKRQEEIILLKDGKFKVLRLPLDNPAIHILQRIRDEAHRFGINYHRLLRKKAFLQL